MTRNEVERKALASYRSVLIWTLTSLHATADERASALDELLILDGILLGDVDLADCS